MNSSLRKVKKMQAGNSLLAFFFIALSLCLTAGKASARPLDDVLESKYIRIFVYENFPPYSYMDENKKMVGVDVEIAKRLAEMLGVRLDLFVRGADETVDDDLRNNVWKGHYIDSRIADVMMHVPVDDELRRRNQLTVITGRYYTERMALLSDPEKVGRSETLAPFLGAKIGVELDTLADFYLSSPTTLGGRLRANAVRYKDFANAMKGLRAGEVEGLMGPRGQLEASVKGLKKEYLISSPPFPGMSKPQWDIGVAINHDSRDLAYEIGDKLLELRKSGELKKIFNKYGLSYYKDFLD